MSIIGIHYEDMLECGLTDIKDDYDFNDKVCYSESKQSEKKKSKTDVSFVIIFKFRISTNILKDKTIFVLVLLFYFC